MLLVLAIWRHVVRRFPFSYDPMYWGAVFPPGMYAACTMRMLDAMDLGFLGLLPHVAFIAGLAAWALLFIGRSDAHTSELQSLMRISYAAFCLQQTYAHRQGIPQR